MLNYQTAGLGPLTGNAAAQTLYTYTLPAGTITAGGQCIDLEFSYAKTGTNSQTLNFVISGTGGGATQTITTGTNAGNYAAVARFCSDADTTHNHFSTLFGDRAGAILTTPGYNATTLDTSASVTIALQWTDTTPDTATGQHWRVVGVWK
jgi:hypothetical protein